MTAQPLAAQPAASEVASRDALPDPHVWAAHIAQAILDTLLGTRPAHQLARWTDPTVYSAILSATPGHPASPGAPRPAVRGIRISMPVAGVAEASVLVQVGPRFRAAAMRLEGTDNRWLCTAFDLI